jgi:hypothetical protein
MTTAIELTATSLKFADGLFSSENRYPRQVANLADLKFWMVQGPSVSAAFINVDYPGWRWECGPATASADATISPATGFAIDRPVAA